MQSDLLTPRPPRERVTPPSEETTLNDGSNPELRQGTKVSSATSLPIHSLSCSSLSSPNSPAVSALSSSLLPALIGFPVPADVTAHPRVTDGQRTVPAKHPPIVDRSFLGIRKRTVSRVDLHELISRRRPIGSRHVWMADPGQSPVRRFDVLARRAERNLQNLVERGGRRRQSKWDLVQSRGVLRAGVRARGGDERRRETR
ncbi:hypothetical protein YC2023_040131 [Brassica napus]